MHDFFGDLVKIWVVVEGVTLDFDLKKITSPVLVRHRRDMHHSIELNEAVRTMSLDFRCASPSPRKSGVSSRPRMRELP
jgi:hypothetical protein